MALFGKKKKAEPTAPQTNSEDEIQIVGGDADATNATDIEDDDRVQVIDFDAIADELGDDDGESALGDPMSDPNARFVPDADNNFDLSATGNGDDPFTTMSGFETAGAANNAGLEDNDELDFDAVFDDGSAGNLAAGAPVAAAAPMTGENPFGVSNAPDIEPIADAATLTSDAPPLTHTAPILTSDLAASGGAPAVRRSLPLLPLLGAVGLLVALGVVGWLVLGNKPAEDATAIAVNPALQATDSAANAAMVSPTGVTSPSGSTAMPGMSSGAVNPGIAVDGVPIAPGPIVQSAPLGGAPTSTGSAVTASPLQTQLKALWNKGAAAKKAGDIAGARAAWTEILRLDPGHDGIQSAIDKLPAA